MMSSCNLKLCIAISVFIHLFMYSFTSFQLFTPTVRTGTVIPQLLPDSFRANGNGGRQLELVQRLQEYGIGSFSSFESKPGYDLQFMKPTPAQVIKLNRIVFFF